jgi:hypothetical protein
MLADENIRARSLDGEIGDTCGQEGGGKGDPRIDAWRKEGMGLDFLYDC